MSVHIVADNAAKIAVLRSMIGQERKPGASCPVRSTYSV